ncbi:hypothetical protein JW960_29050 [candidate division KSB1 bacterium]|nr:hypothetical protein [candidate division KSB1 bacterium]
MKTKLFFITIISLIIMLNTRVYARWDSKSAGLTFRSSYWHMDSSPNQIRISDDLGTSSVHVGGVGGWLAMFSRYDENVWLEFSIGGVANVNVVEYDMFDENVDVQVTTPVLLGIRYDLLNPENPGAFRPYLSVGAGPYWITDIHVEDRMEEEQVDVNTKLKSGGYTGGGLNFMLSNWCALNLDMRYHFINLKPHHPNSGYEAGLGITFMWGSYQK